jgi:hypothetical protein
MANEEQKKKKKEKKEKRKERQNRFPLTGVHRCILVSINSIT